MLTYWCSGTTHQHLFWWMVLQEWFTLWHRFWQGQALHFQVLESPASTYWCKTEDVHHVPSQNRWSKQMYQQNSEPGASIPHWMQPTRLGTRPTAHLFWYDEHNQQINWIHTFLTSHGSQPLHYSSSYSGQIKHYSHRCGCLAHHSTTGSRCIRSTG